MPEVVGQIGTEDTVQQIIEDFIPDTSVILHIDGESNPCRSERFSELPAPLKKLHENMAEDAVECEPFSLLTGKSTGNLPIS